MEEEVPLKGDTEDQNPFQTPKSNAITMPYSESVLRLLLLLWLLLMKRRSIRKQYNDENSWQKKGPYF
jgi:hypothetical protein